MKKILFTGGSGFVGRNFISMFNNKYSFINLGRTKNNLCENIEWDLKGKMPDRLNDYKFDTLVHCASVVGTDSKTSSRPSNDPLYRRL
jgi:nucleoside-diphosphate-sugar epimerase